MEISDITETYTTYYGIKEQITSTNGIADGKPTSGVVGAPRPSLHVYMTLVT